VAPAALSAASADQVGPVAPTSVGDDCWAPDTKQTMRDVLSDSLDKEFSGLKGQLDSLDEVISSPRSVGVEKFGLNSVDENAGHLQCTSWVTMEFRTKHYGVIVVPESAVGFDIVRTEAGESVTMNEGDLYGLLKALSVQLKKVGIKFTVSMRSTPAS
jgi:hypothetical protein